MNRFPKLVIARVLIRSLSVQGSWNYRTLIGSGFAYALLPALRFIYRDRPAELQAAVRRHTELFNSHPYLSAKRSISWSIWSTGTVTWGARGGSQCNGIAGPITMPGDAGMPSRISATR